MALFQRIKSPFADKECGAQGPPTPEAQSVGQALRDRRLALDINLADAAAALRIKPGYLAAIEDGRLDQLPGATYAVGFVRSYGDYLGLHTAELLQRFKLEAAGLNAKPDLAFPMPLNERSLPAGGLLTIAILLAACGYGVWYHLTATERAERERVTDVPSTLLETGDGTKATVSAAIRPPLRGPSIRLAAPEPSQNQPESRVSARFQPDDPHTTTVPDLSGSGPVKPSATGVAGAGLPPLAPAPVTAAASRMAPETEKAPSSAPASVVPVAPAAASSPPGVLASPSSGVPMTEASPTASAVGAPNPTEAFAHPSPQSNDGQPEDSSRIMVRANADSWVQIRSADHIVLFTAVLRPGDIYRVPNREGLTMRAGNAGGLDIIVDGKPAPTLGPMGAVRNVSLDPQTLIGRGAAHD